MVPIILALCLWAQAPAQAPANLPDRVADYRAFLTAQQLFDAGDPQKAIESLKPIWNFVPVSPLLGRAAILGARSYQALGNFADALELLRGHAGRLPQPAGWLLLAHNAEAAGDNAAATAYYQRVYYEYPVSNDATDAENALAKLKEILAENFPPAMPQVRLERAARLARGGKAAQAREEYAAMAPDFGGLERDLARVRAVADNFRALDVLRVTSAEADAERLYTEHAAARRAKAPEQALAAIEELSRRYPKSRWRLRALISHANDYLVKNEVSQYEPIYRTCYQEFPNEPEAASCHWKVAWASYLRREGTARFEEHLRLFPRSEKSGAALYFLGRRTELASRYPLSYYATLSGTNTKRTQSKVDFEPGQDLKIRLKRAQDLEAAALPEWAEVELQWAAQNEPNSYPAALALAETASRRGAFDVSIRYIKKFAPGYLSIPMEAAPERFWKIAFPLPYRVALESNSRTRELDPYIVAALVRQESEFDPKAISSARAYGLTQVLPSTGRQLSRRLGITRFSPSMLFEPEINLKLGTYYLKTLFDQQNGSWVQTLASYNAGKRHADEWATWATFREPSEYIETIPFTETRNYIQIVLRNAHVYRRLYAANER